MSAHARLGKPAEETVYNTAGDGYGVRLLDTVQCSSCGFCLGWVIENDLSFLVRSEHDQARALSLKGEDPTLWLPQTAGLVWLRPYGWAQRPDGRWALSSDKRKGGMKAELRWGDEDDLRPHRFPLPLPILCPFGHSQDLEESKLGRLRGEWKFGYKGRHLVH